jgi:TldD protein
MGATFAAAGALSPEEILEGVRKGIYVRRMEAASTDPRRGRAVFRVSDADLIRSGRLEQPLHPHLLHVDGPKTLRNVTGVADDLLFDTCIGSCHRDGQALAISVGAPTICIGVAEVAP